MALAHIIDDVSGLPEAVAKEYIKGDDGKYRLDVTGMVPSSKLVEFRDNNISLKQQLEAFNGVDPAKYKELQNIEKQLKESKLVDAGKIDELVSSRVESMKTSHLSEISDRDKKLEIANRQLETLLIDSSVRAAAATASVLPTAVDDILLRAKSVFKIVDGQAVPVNSNGQTIYGQDGVNPMSVSEWIKGVSKSAPHLFAGSQGGGAGGSRSSSSKSQNMSPLQKIQSGLDR